MCSWKMVGQNRDCFGEIGTGPPVQSHISYDTRTIRTTTKKVLEMLLDLPQAGTMVEAAAPATGYRLSRPNQIATRVRH